MDSKQRAAEAALAEIRDGMIVGLGSGSTADCFIRALGSSLREGKLKDIRAIPSSLNSERLANELSIPLVAFDEVQLIDVTIDGADEIAPDLSLIKGLGGALLREKIVAQNSKRLVIIADDSKTVSQLGLKSPLPVEVVPFALAATERFLRSLDATPTLRMTDGKPFVTDNGNHIFDCRFPNGIARDESADVLDADSLDELLASRAGIVEHGLFINLASVAYVATSAEVKKVVRP